jgi:ribonuclease VapC
MIFDTSAILAILLNEPDMELYIDALNVAKKRMMSAPTLFELMVVIEAKKGESGSRELDLFLHRAKIEIIPFDADQAEIARVAWKHFGKGNHAAGLNYGDCFAYALAKQLGEPLLFKGSDFSKTDIKKALLEN